MYGIHHFCCLFWLNSEAYLFDRITHFGWFTNLRASLQFLLFQSGSLCEWTSAILVIWACPIAQPIDNEDYRTSLTRSRSFGCRLFVKTTKLCGYGFSVYYKWPSSEESTRIFFQLLSIIVDYFISLFSLL